MKKKFSVEQIVSMLKQAGRKSGLMGKLTEVLPARAVLKSQMLRKLTSLDVFRAITY